MTARKIILPVVILAVAAALGYQFLVGRAGDHSGVVRVSGNIELIDAEVSFKIPGRVEQRLVDEGEPVEQRQVVALLDTSDLKCDVALRRAEYQAAYNALVELENGSRPEEVAAAWAAVQRAQALADETEAGSRPQEIDVAKAAKRSAQFEETRSAGDLKRAASLFFESRTITQEEYDRQKATHDVAVERLNEAIKRLELAELGPRDEQKRQARAALAQAKAQYELVKAGPREEVRAQAAAKVAQAAAALDLAQTKLGYATLVSPLTGIVLSKNIEPGEYVSPGTPVITVGDMVNVWLRAYIAETDQDKVKVGQEVRVTTDAHPGKVYPGRVSFIAQEAEFTPKNVQTPKERIKLVYRIKVDIKNPSMELKRGMPADGEILVGSD